MRVRIITALPGLVIADVGQVQGPSGKWLRLFPKGEREYLHFNLYRDKRWLQYAVHFAVCTAFHGPRPDGMVVRHLDGNSHNNHADNLCWGTQLENEADKVRHGTVVRGERHPSARLTAADVRAIRRIGGSPSELARTFGVSPTTITNVLARQTWRHV